MTRHTVPVQTVLLVVVLWFALSVLAGALFGALAQHAKEAGGLRHHR